MKKLTAESATRAVNRLALMAFFPADAGVRGALVDVVMEITDSQEQLDWLVARALKLYARWPGVAELRALYCSKWPPRDGVTTYSSIYLDGIPSERNSPSPPPPAPGSDDPELDRALKEAAKKKSLRKEK